MRIWTSIKQLLDPAASLEDQRFSMGNRGKKPAVEERNPTRLADTHESAQGVMTHIDSLLAAQGDGPDSIDKAGDLTASLAENLARLKRVFRMPTNKDVIIREFEIATQPPTKAAIAFMEGLSDKTTINDNILLPLMLLSHHDHHSGQGGEHGPTAFSMEAVLARLLPGHQISEKPLIDDIAESLLAGDTVLFCDGARVAIAVETKKPPGRSVGEPKNEPVVWGPKDAFTEAWRVNVALVRRRLKDPRLVTEIMTVGTVSRNYVGMLYIDGIVSPKLVAEVKRRIESLEVDIVNDSSILEQYIEDTPATFLPAVMTTERPDRTAGYLSEGHVALFVDNSPYAMIAPTTFWSLLQTAEDYYLRYPFGTILRYLRLIALIMTIALPAFYVATVNYHHEMLPTSFMLFIAANREKVPMPSLYELLAMDIAFELIRETAVRIPGMIGPTMGLVASLVLGQAAVSAQIVSPVVIIIVALSGLASFAIPNYMAAFGIRWLRFLFLGGAAVLGYYGLAMVGFALTLHTAAARSFGVPYLTPVAPFRGGVRDVLIRPHMYQMEQRPTYVHPMDQRRQAEPVRAWDPASQAIVDTDQQSGGSGKGD